jgi:para-aminobenzoate synthetase / 4-amino-4-deoxychorismate lyase
MSCAGFTAARRHAQTRGVIDPSKPFLLFDDARAGAPLARLYADPHAVVAASTMAEVEPALAALSQAVRGGAHAAGFLTYEAGYALDPALADVARQAEGPLLWFGLFDGFSLVDAAAVLPSAAGARAGAPRPRIERDDYLSAATRVHDHLLDGDLYQANLTFGCEVAVLGNPLALYAALRQSSGAGWGGVVRHPGGWLLSGSPEQFFSLGADGRIEARPMKGTATRGTSPEETAAFAEALRTDPKQRAENLMIVDLLRNDLARVSQTGSIEVPQLFHVEHYPTLLQMVSVVTARLRPGLDAVDVLRTIFPCGSITGAPKVAAMTRLAALEPVPRGAYTGSMGWLAPDGSAAFNVLIRTLELADGSGRGTLGLGSGLVVDSRGGDEWAECLSKGAFVNRANSSVDLIETMLFDPRDGLVELDRHLDRLTASADALGFRFDRHGARNELQAATFRRRFAAMTRLLLSPTGAMAVEVRDLKPLMLPLRVKMVPLPVDAQDYRLRFKTTDRDFYDEARRDSGADEVLFVDADGFLTEGSWTSLFVERDGVLHTPPLSRGLLPGVLRAKLLDEGRAIESDLREEDLAGGFQLGNMLRGLMPAVLG